jgi:hypothetical protein
MDIKHHIEMMKKNNFKIEELYFLESPHVGHFRKYPEQYSSKVLEFMKSNLKK